MPKVVASANNFDELLRSANGASGTARNSWLAFMALITYLLVTIAGVTHVDLLLNSPITLPIVNAKIPLFSFFLVAPFLLLLIHLGLLVQHAMLAHKLAHFSIGISTTENRESRDHPSRRYVDGYVFSQLLAGPSPPMALNYLMRLMFFVTLSVLPVFVLIYFQIKFLPYHDVAVTHANRVAILLDLVLLFLVRPFIAMPHLRPAGRRLRLGSENWFWEISYFSFGVSSAMYLVVVIFSLFVATVPQGCINPFEEPSQTCSSLDTMTAEWLPRNVGSDKTPREVFAPTALLFENGKAETTGKTTNPIFTRNLVVSDTDLVPDKDDQFEEVSISLRGRDLRFAVLDRSDLHLADLTNANLKWSSLYNTNIEKAKLISAELQGADLSFAKLQGANLSEAELQGADLSDAELQGANLLQAKLQGANLLQAKLQGANLFQAELQGAILRYAKLQGANLRQAKLQGANLIQAELEGANLHQAKLQGANLIQAKLQGADLRGAKLQGADIRRTSIWQTLPPKEISLEHANLTLAYIKPLKDRNRKRLQELIADEEDTNWGAALKASLGTLLKSETKGWGDSEEHRRWKKYVSREQSESYPIDLSIFLGDLVCDDDSYGYIAKAITKRASPDGLFTGDLDTFWRRVSEKDCRGAKLLDDESKVKLCETLASWAKADIKNSFCTP